MSNYAEYNFYFYVFQFLFNCMIGMIVWWRTREKANESALMNVSSDLQAKLESARIERDEQCRIHKQETEKIKADCGNLHINVGGLPNSKQVDRIHERLDGLLKMVSNMEGEIKGMSHTLDLLQEHHIKGGV